MTIRIFENRFGLSAKITQNNKIVVNSNTTRMYYNIYNKCFLIATNLIYIRFYR